MVAGYGPRQPHFARAQAHGGVLVGTPHLCPTFSLRRVRRRFRQSTRSLRNLTRYRNAFITALIRICISGEVCPNTSVCNTSTPTLWLLLCKVSPWTHVGEGLGLLSHQNPHDVIICCSQQIFNERLSKIRHLRRRTPSPLLHQHWLHNVNLPLLGLFASPLFAGTYILLQPPPGNTISSLPLTPHRCITKN